MIALKVNGELFRSEEALTVAQLIDKLDLKNKKVAIERNGEIVPRSRFGDQKLSNGDKIEVVVAVGGG